MQPVVSVPGVIQALYSLGIILDLIAYHGKPDAVESCGGEVGMDFLSQVVYRKGGQERVIGGERMMEEKKMQRKMMRLRG